MEKNHLLTRILATIGTLLVWLPLLAPVFFSISAFFTRPGSGLRFDYLMPAELFPLALVGAGLLLWAAIRQRRLRGLIGWGLGGAVFLLFASQGLAVLTGLADGRTEPGGWQSALVLGALVAYILAVVAIAVGGVLLLRDLFRPIPAAG